MSLRTRLRIAIVALAAIVVIAISGLYLYDFTRLAFEAAHSRAHVVAEEVQDYVVERVNEVMAARNQQPSSQQEFQRLATEIIRTDPLIASKLRRSVADANVILDIEVTDSGGYVLAAFHDTLIGKRPPSAIDFASLKSRNALLNLWDLANRHENYSVVLGLGAAPGPPTLPLFQVRVIIPSVLLRNYLTPAFLKLGAGFMISLAGAMFLAALIPILVFGPLERVSQSIERISAGEAVASTRPTHETREFAAVQSKLNILGQQYQGARQNAQELRQNIEQLLARLEEAVLLFDADGRLTMAGPAVERLMGRSRNELIGRTQHEIFSNSTGFGRAILEAVEQRQPWHEHLLEFTSDGSGPLRVLVSIQPVPKSSGGYNGTLVTLRDADTRHQVALQLDVSSRLAAVSRLTSGVAHEIKNPLNAMALHLEVLRSRLEGEDAEIDIISREIKRLDHVVKTFLNFNKPIHLQLTSVDLTMLAHDLAALVKPDAEAKGVAVTTELNGSLWINADQDLVRQAVLNIVMNGIEAMGEGGHLALRTAQVNAENVIMISDDGPGIPPDIQDKIFNLYFSTKEHGSGIGLALAFRVVQMHSGTIDFVTEPGKGTSFRLRFPRLVAMQDENLTRAAGTRIK